MVGLHSKYYYKHSNNIAHDVEKYCIVFDVSELSLTTECQNYHDLSNQSKE